MAAPTNVRVEAVSITANIIRWSYSGSDDISVYRSDDGSSYSEITDVLTRPEPGTEIYTDEGLDAGTKYWYKLSDDEGSTFSSVVTVWTHGCPTPSSHDQQLGLPDNSLRDLARRVEELFQDKVIDPSKCIVCDDDGRLIFDCSNGCAEFQAIITADVNSVTFQNCPEGVPVDLVVPPNSTRKVCGFPAGMGFLGDSCHNSPFIAGPDGMTVTIGGGSSGQSRPTMGIKQNSGSGGGGAGCTCTPGPNNALTIKSCNNNNSLNCGSTKRLQLLACGGIGPYSWTRTGSVGLKGTQPGATVGSTATGNSITVTPPANTGSGVAGTAYFKHGGHHCGTILGAPLPNCDGASFLDVYTEPFGCNDQSLGSCGSVGGFAQTDGCLDGTVGVGVNGCASVSTCFDGQGCNYGVCDNRSAAMISGNCVPCGLSSGATVTVTDAAGNEATIVLRA